MFQVQVFVRGWPVQYQTDLFGKDTCDSDSNLNLGSSAQQVARLSSPQMSNHSDTPRRRSEADPGYACERLEVCHDPTVYRPPSRLFVLQALSAAPESKARNVDPCHGYSSSELQQETMNDRL